MTPQARCSNCFKALPHDATTALLCGRGVPESTIKHVKRNLTARAESVVGANATVTVRERIERPAPAPRARPKREAVRDAVTGDVILYRQPDNLSTSDGAALGLMRAAAAFHSPDGVQGRVCQHCIDAAPHLCWRGLNVRKNLAELEREMGLAP